MTEKGKAKREGGDCEPKKPDLHGPLLRSGGCEQLKTSLSPAERLPPGGSVSLPATSPEHGTAEPGGERQPPSRPPSPRSRPAAASPAPELPRADSPSLRQERSLPSRCRHSPRAPALPFPARRRARRASPSPPRPAPAARRGLRPSPHCAPRSAQLSPYPPRLFRPGAPSPGPPSALSRRGARSAGLPQPPPARPSPARLRRALNPSLLLLASLPTAAAPNGGSALTWSHRSAASRRLRCPPAAKESARGAEESNRPALRPRRSSRTNCRPPPLRLAHAQPPSDWARAASTFPPRRRPLALCGCQLMSLPGRWLERAAGGAGVGALGCAARWAPTAVSALRRRAVAAAVGRF